MTDSSSATLAAALSDLMRWLDATRAPSMIVGGVAASTLGRPRFTLDVDVLAALTEAEQAESIRRADEYGIHPRVADVLQFARRSRVLLMRHKPSGIDIDVILGDLPFELAALARCRSHEIGGVCVRLPQVEDLVVMKAVARRPKDVEDLKGLLEAHPKLDVGAARVWIREFATAMSMPDLLSEFDAMVARLRPSP